MATKVHSGGGELGVVESLDAVKGEAGRTAEGEGLGARATILTLCALEIGATATWGRSGEARGRLSALVGKSP